MVLDLKILNSDAELNSFFEIGNAMFNPGYPLTLNMRLYNPQRNLRHVPDPGATFSLTLTNSDATTFTVIPVVLDAGDRSILTVDLTGVQTQNLIGQNLKLEINEGGELSLACAQMGLKAAKSSC